VLAPPLRLRGASTRVQPFVSARGLRRLGVGGGGIGSRLAPLVEEEAEEIRVRRQHHGRAFTAQRAIGFQRAIEVEECRIATVGLVESADALGIDRFAVAGEEFGLILCVIVVGLFAVVVLQGLLRALKDDDLFVVLAVGALVSLFGAQALMNMASTVHLIPPKGTTLPFVSYGGSASIALAWTMGMVLALTRERPSWGTHR